MTEEELEEIEVIGMAWDKDMRLRLMKFVNNENFMLLDDMGTTLDNSARDARKSYVLVLERIAEAVEQLIGEVKRED